MLDIEPAPSRRERKKSATRDALHEAALSLTEERGLAAVTVDAIADRADVATRTFFNHFGTKVDAVLGRDPDRGERLARAVEDRPAGDSPLEVLRHVLVDDITRRDATVADLLRRMRVVRSEAALLAALSVSCEDVERQMTDAVARRVGVDPAVDVYPSLLVVASLNAVRVAILRWCDQGGDRPVETLVHHVFDQLAAGLSRPLVAAGGSPVTATEQPAPVGAGTLVPEYNHRQIMVIMSGLMLGMLLAALDQTIVSTALTVISKDLKRTDLYSWVVTSYLLTSTVTTPLYGKISDLYGRKRIFQFAIVLFLIGSALSGVSQTMYQLIIFRGVQGLGAGGLISLAMAIVGDVIPPRERGRYQGYFGAMFGAASVIGPLTGGFLVDAASWRWVFYVNLPLGFIALVVINRVLHLDHKPRKARIDVTGALLLVTGVSLILVGVQEAGEHARVTSTTWLFFVVGLVLVVAFVLWERRATEPVLPLRLFRNGVFRICSTLALITGSVMFGAIIFLPQFLQTVRGISPTVSGLRLLPLLAGMLITSIGSGRLITLNGRYKMYVIVGTGTVTVGMAWLTQLHTSTSLWVLSGMLFVVGFGMGLFMQILVLATQNAISREDMGVGTSAIQFFRTLGGAIGASVLGAILIAKERTSLPRYLAQDKTTAVAHAYTYGMTHAFLWTIPIGVVSFGLSFLLKEVRLRSTLGGGGASEPAAEPVI